jgi:hypothetical protein
MQYLYEVQRTSQRSMLVGRRLSTAATEKGPETAPASPSRISVFYTIFVLRHTIYVYLRTLFVFQRTKLVHLYTLFVYIRSLVVVYLLMTPFPPVGCATH